MRGLIIKSPWIDKILSGKKTWEIRGSNTKIRGQIALIKSGSGNIYGTCELVNVIGPLSRNDFLNSENLHSIPKSLFSKTLSYKKTYAWVLENAKMFKDPIAYKHPSGAVIWVRLANSSL